MKRIYQTMFRILFAGVLMLTCHYASGQIIFTSIPDSSALVGETYNYDVEAVASPDPATFSLDVKPTGMIINASSGLISWTPSAVNQGGKVVVKAVNSAGTYFQTYYLFVSDAITCPAGLQSYWKLDQALFAGDSTPDYSSSYDAYALSDMPDTIGKVNKALKFRNSTQYLRVPDRNQYEWQRSSDFSFSLWFKHTGDFSQDEVFIARANGSVGAWVILGIDYGAQQLVFRLRTNWTLADTAQGDEIAYIEGPTITNNVWHHVVAVYDGNSNNGTNITLKLYYDGVKYQTNRWLNADYGFDAVNKDLTIGWFDVYQPGITFQFKGTMDDVSIFNKALSDGEATSIYNTGVTNKPLCQAGNHVPLIISTPVTAVNEDSPYSYTIIGRDYEGTALTKSAVVRPSWLSFNTSTGVLNGTPRQSNTGDTTVTLRVSDGAAFVDQTFAISVTAVNFSPVITSTPEDSAKVGEVYTYQLEITDQDPYDVHTYSAVTKPTWLIFQPATGILTGIPTASNLGSHNITLSVNDGTETVNQSFTIVVYNPTALNDNKLSDALVGRIYPVPARGTVNFDLNLTGHAQIQIMSLNGEILKHIDVNSGQKTVSVDVSDLKPATYLYKVMVNKESQVGKLVIE